MTLEVTSDIAGVHRVGAVMREFPSWQVPAGALEEFLRLTVALLRLETAPACTSEPELWWATGSSARAVTAQAEAVEACSWCPVLQLCRSYAVAADEREGVWGGTTPAERRALAGRRR